MTRKSYQREWFGISFESFTTSAPDILAGPHFYDAFYREFNRRYRSWEDLPAAWRLAKEKVAGFLRQCTGDGDTLLSIGCGNGYIEFLLSTHARRIVAIEPSTEATQMLQRAAPAVRVFHGYFPRALPQGAGPFALGYTVATEYVFDDHGLLAFLASVRRYGTFPFMLISASVYRASVNAVIRQAGRALLRSAKIRMPEQFWGYERTPRELIRIFRKAGYPAITAGELGSHFWVRGDGA